MLRDLYPPGKVVLERRGKPSHAQGLRQVKYLNIDSNIKYNKIYRRM